MRSSTVPVMAAVAAALLVLLSARTLCAQPPPGPLPEPRNLQVLPKGSTRQQVLVPMRTFTAGLGVQCNYCHVEDANGRGNMAADDKPTKQTARAMMRMVAQINETIASAVGKPATEVTKVECVTCHRGEPIPKNPAPGQAPPH